MVNEIRENLISNGAATITASLAAAAIRKFQSGGQLTEYEQGLIRQVQPAINQNPSLKVIVQPST